MGSQYIDVTPWDTLYFSWWEVSQSIPDNTTTIAWELQLWSGSSGRIDSSAPKNWTVTINGQKFSGTNYVGIDNNTYEYIANGTTDPITHNADGTKTISWSYTQQFDIDFGGEWIGTVSDSGTIDLTKIPQKSTLTVANGTLGMPQTLTVKKNSVNFAHSIKAVCGNSTVYIKKDGSTSTTEVKYTNTSISFTPPISWASQNTSGTSVSVKFIINTYTADWSTSVVGSNTYTVTMTIPSGNTLTVSNGTLGTPLALGVSTQLSGLTHTITYKCGTASGTICTKSSATSFTWNANNGNTLSLASQNTTGTSVAVVFTITTYSGNTVLSTATKTISMNIPTECSPSCTIEVIDTNSTAQAHGGFIKGISKLKVNVYAYTSYNSEIASYKTTVNDMTYFTQNFTTDTLKSSGVIRITATVTDKRGRTGTTTYDIAVIDYAPPAITFISVLRCNEDGTENDEGSYVRVRYSGNITPINNNNGHVWELQYKKSADTDDKYSKITLNNTDYSITNGTYIFAADTESSYDVKLLVSDNFYNANSTDSAFKPISVVTSASTAFTIMDYGADGKSVAFGKVAEMSGVFDMGFLLRTWKGILQPVLEPDSDFDTLLIPNTYTLKNVTSVNYRNCPIKAGTGILKIECCGEASQLRQSVITCDSARPQEYERFYYIKDGVMSWYPWRRKHEIELYNDDTGSNGSIPLTESVKNFKFIEIFFTDNQGYSGGYTKVYSPNGKTVCLSIVEAAASSYTYIRRTKYTISETAISPETATAGYARVTGTAVDSSSGTNYIKIKRVVGYE